MPTPVSVARDCLANDAVKFLNEAVNAARRRSHAQTTSLHVVYALIIAPSAASSSNSSTSTTATSSILRDALARARSSACSPRLQFKALEFCFGVALDRLPSSAASSSSADADGPPVSNSLMAAIKRSQANQRRNPDTFHLYQQQQACSGASTTFSGVKVELQQLVLAILDDPVVSRVFGDAGFRSTDIKIAVLRPPPPILRFPRGGTSRCPPLFLCSLSAGNGFDPMGSGSGIVFPFSAGGARMSFDGSDENCRRIAEILCRGFGGRNPMLVGVGSGEAARDFIEAVEKRNWDVFPMELRGIRIVSVESELAKIGKGEREAVTGFFDELALNTRVGRVVLSIGDLKGMVEGGGEVEEETNFIVSEITRVLEACNGRMWVIGWSATYETYMKFLLRYPLLDKDWSLQLLPITSVRGGVSGAGGSSVPRSSSLKESFVPFGGLFPTKNESKNLLNNSYPLASRCEQCNEKCEQEVGSILEGHSSSNEDQQSRCLPSWLRKASASITTDDLHAVKDKDDKTVLNAKISEIQKKWNDCCQRLHQSCKTINTSSCQVIPFTVDPLCASDKAKSPSQNSQNVDVSPTQTRCRVSFPVPVGFSTSQSISVPTVVEARNKVLVPNLEVRVSKSEELQRKGFQPQQGTELDNRDDRASPSSITSVKTDLALGTLYELQSDESTPTSQVRKQLSGYVPFLRADSFRQNIPQVHAGSYSRPAGLNSTEKTIQTLIPDKPISKVSNICASANQQNSLVPKSGSQKQDVNYSKSFFTDLFAKVRRQEKAISAICQAIACCRSSERRRGSTIRKDIWLSFHGADRLGKKRIAMVLSEIMFGSKECFISIDLNYQDRISHPSTICGQQDTDESGIGIGRKIDVDQITDELRTRLGSIFFLENVDKADSPVQEIIHQAIQTGKFRDAKGRESSLNNAIFILTSAKTSVEVSFQRNENSNFCEKNILEAQCWQMKVFVEPCRVPVNNNRKTNVSISQRQTSGNKQITSFSPTANKRKLDFDDSWKRNSQFLSSPKKSPKASKTFLDLNLPVEEVEGGNEDSSGHETNSASDNSETSCTQDLFNLVDARVDFEPFDFDALAESLLREISKTFSSAVGPNWALDINSKVMEQVLAAAWSTGDTGALHNWLGNVLGRSFFELRHRYNLSSNILVRLVASEDAYYKEHAPRIFLPSAILLDL